MSLTEQQDKKSEFYRWFNSGLKDVLEDNRRRYRMKLDDEEERLDRGLSALPSTKSVSTVDNFVIEALNAYHGEEGAMAYSAKDNASPEVDDRARWLTEIVKYRMQNTFPFSTWHIMSLKASAADGLEGAMVRWRLESYDENVKKYYFVGEDGQRQEIDERIYNEGMRVNPQRFMFENAKEKVVTKDTWWVDQLKPGENLLWDFKNPLLDLNEGEWCMVILPKTITEIQQLAENGIFDKISKRKVREKLSKHQGIKTDEYVDHDAVGSDPLTEETGDDNRVPVWLYFRKKNARWYCEFSAEGETILSSERPVDEVFWNNRRINRVPVVLGCTDFELWEPIGRGIPKLIAPVEDEYIDQKNNANDFAKQVIQGRWRINPDADVDVDSILNSRAFLAEAGEVEQLPAPPGFMEAMRQSDSHSESLQELIPLGTESRNLVPKGTLKTLGAHEMAEGTRHDKLDYRLLIRNETFMKPLMYLLAQLEFAFETDEMVLRIAGTKTKTGRKAPDGQEVPFQVPQAPTPQGSMVVDLRALDFEVEVKINAGTGTTSRKNKARKLIEIAEWRKANGIPTDMKVIAEQINILNGFEANQFDAPPDPEGDKPQIDVDINIDFEQLPGEVRNALMAQMMGGGKVEMNLRENKFKKKMREQIEEAAINAQAPTPAMMEEK